MARVVRPVVRSFRAAFVRRAAAYVRSGGHAVVWDSDARARLVVPVPKEGDESDLALWSMLDLGCDKWKAEAAGTLRGLATIRVPRECLDIVRWRAERDSIFKGPTRTMNLDCMRCGACCVDNEVILEKADLLRFEKARRLELSQPPFA